MRNRIGYRVDFSAILIGLLMLVFLGLVVYVIIEMAQFEKECHDKGGSVVTTSSEEMICIDSKTILMK